MAKVCLLLIVLLSPLKSQDEIAILSSRVGTLIDIHENRFYRIFPKVRNFISAQVYLKSSNDYKVRIVVNRKAKRRLTKKTCL
ncbi:MAG: hypothetical protein ACJZ1Y_03825 [Candidatus Neomarinimicrobiota bacterium]